MYYIIYIHNTYIYIMTTKSPCCQSTSDVRAEVEPVTVPAATSPKRDPCVCMYVCIYIYMSYTEREREREKERCMYTTCVCTRIYIYDMYISLSIYICIHICVYVCIPRSSGIGARWTRTSARAPAIIISISLIMYYIMLINYTIYITL